MVKANAILKKLNVQKIRTNTIRATRCKIAISITYEYRTLNQVIANPVVYALRIPEFKEAWALNFLRKPAGPSIEEKISRNEKTLALTRATELTTLSTNTSILQLAFEQEVLDTKL